jgi:transcriptional regulator with PAS, ATPase and Fis domain
VIAATNRCLTSEIREKHFREDLYFRLSVVSLHLPPLRERPGDIPGLVQYHTRRAAMKLGVPVPKMSDDAMTLLMHYHWPGNIRELQNALEQALVQETGGTVMPRDLPPSVVLGPDAAIMTRATVDKDDKEQLVTELRRHRGNHTKAAAALGISRTTLWRRLRRQPSSAELAPAPELSLTVATT